MSAERSARSGEKSTQSVLRLHKGADRLCNLCLSDEEPLTNDHVPTRGWGNDKPVMVRRIYAGHDGNVRVVQTQCRAGVRFKTICRRCNNERLGSRHDRELKHFIDAVKISERRNEKVAVVSVRAGALVRALLGHFVAAKLSTDDVHADKYIRSYILEGQPLPRTLGLYVWHFPFDEIVICRDFVWANFRDGIHSGLMSVIKFRPLAVAMTLDTNMGNGAIALHQYASHPASESVSLQLPLGWDVAREWPEMASNVDFAQAVMLGDAAYSSGLTSR